MSIQCFHCDLLTSVVIMMVCYVFAIWDVCVYLCKYSVWVVLMFLLT